LAAALTIGAAAGATMSAQSVAQQNVGAAASMQNPAAGYTGASAMPGQTAAMPAPSNYPPYPMYRGAFVAEGAPCAPTMADGRVPHYTWKAGYVQKARWEYHWACEL
jgi:hypothetical protein